jgi:hypothetical protein
MNDSPEQVEQNLSSERIYIVNNVILGGVDDLDEDLVESVDKLMLTYKSDGNGDDTFWDTGATRAVFHDCKVFKNYQEFRNPIQVNRFGSNLATVTQGLGWVDLESEVEEERKTFMLTEVLHISDARCNLILSV